MIPLLVIGGITAALALLAKRAPAAAAANAVPASSPPIGSAVTPTPSTPPALFTTPDMEALYHSAVAARVQSGIPIQAAQQPATRPAAPVYVFPVAPRIAPVAPATARAPIAQVGTGGGGTGGRTKYSLF